MSGRVPRPATTALAVVVALAVAAAPSSAAAAASGHNHRPDRPTGLTTSPATVCAATPATLVADGTVTLYTPVSDPDGGTLGVRFNLWKSAAPGTILVTSDPTLLTYPSGGTAVRVVPPETLRGAAGGAITEFSWRVQVTDFHKTSAWSATCRFRFDPTRTLAPVVTPPAGATVGEPVAVDVDPPASGSVPSGYVYQLNSGPPASVPAAADGTATISIVPDRSVNSLTVTGLSPGGNPGASASVTFVAAPRPPAADGDLTGDGEADLVTVGAAHGLPSGLWLAAGDGTGAIAATATNLGAYGNGVSGTNSPTDFDGATVITGRFLGGGQQDVMVYYRTRGGGVILRGSGDGSPIRADLSGNSVTVAAGYLTDLDNHDPVQLVNAGDSSGHGTAYPDLLSVNGDDTAGYYLAYYAVQGGGGTLNWQWPPAQLTTPTPAGGTDWDTWTITTAQTAGGTAMFLWQAGTGELHLWDDLAFDADTSTLSYTAYALSSGWNTGQSLTPHGGDIDGDGTADLWTVGAGGTATAWLVSDLAAGTGTITAQPSGTIVPGGAG